MNENKIMFEVNNNKNYKVKAILNIIAFKKELKIGYLLEFYYLVF